MGGKKYSSSKRKIRSLRKRMKITAEGAVEAGGKKMIGWRT
jgi:hypothetical protein